MGCYFMHSVSGGFLLLHRQTACGISACCQSRTHHTYTAMDHPSGFGWSLPARFFRGSIRRSACPMVRRSASTGTWRRSSRSCRGSARASKRCCSAQVLTPRGTSVPSKRCAMPCAPKARKPACAGPMRSQAVCGP